VDGDCSPSIRNILCQDLLLRTVNEGKINKRTRGRPRTMLRLSHGQKKRRTVQEDEIKAADREEQCAFRTRELYQQ